MKASVDQNLDCSLHLGELEISAAELLALRPGTRIGFKPAKGPGRSFKSRGGRLGEGEY